MDELKSFGIESTNENGDVDYQVDANGDAITNEAGEKQVVMEDVYYKSDVEKAQAELQGQIDKLTADGKLKDENFAAMRDGKGGGDKKDPDPVVSEVKPAVDVVEVVAKALAKQGVNNTVNAALVTKYGTDQDKIKAATVVFDKLYTEGADVGQVIAQSINAIGPGVHNANYSGKDTGGHPNMGGKQPDGNKSQGLASVEYSLNKLTGPETNKDKK